MAERGLSGESAGHAYPESGSGGTASQDLIGFAPHEITFGDWLRGVRASKNKSLLDVQRDLRIKVAYIAAIENTDPGVFEIPAFVPGYVRSYARYLDLEPGFVFTWFCSESGFSTERRGAHGISPQDRDSTPPQVVNILPVRDCFTLGKTPFVPVERAFDRLELPTVGSLLVFLSMIVGLGYGGWQVLRQIQRIDIAPAEQTPDVLASADPLYDAGPAVSGSVRDGPLAFDSLERLYRPPSLDVPVVTPRDAPVWSLDPREIGVYRNIDQPREESPEPVVAQAPEPEVAPQPIVVEEAPKTVAIVTVRPSWVRVHTRSGSVLYEGIMEAQARYEVPVTEELLLLRSGNSGAVYFSVGERLFGPVGANGAVEKNIELTVEAVIGKYPLADPAADRELARLVAEANRESPQAPKPLSPD